ncbi:MAG: heterocyst frequency control protein PatD [Plectolyngbya sp. WJT66-NPBG17]|jgi:hypothetical protein|nr:heterocyst frequency control protein PatD [Plectolyngbya sp. WJT66-NPBG17]MBW4524568.1 heterocyst frequency control protein PatD [Phormidium tanganyikae FI6-MK23]
MLTENQVQQFRLLQTTIDSLDQALNSTRFDQSEINQKIRSLQKFFREEIQPIQSDEYQTHSVLVEINKQMRLLTIDGTFLQTARQAETIENRAGQIRDRIKLLTNYCAVILGTRTD